MCTLKLLKEAVWLCSLSVLFVLTSPNLFFIFISSLYQFDLLFINQRDNVTHKHTDQKENTSNNGLYWRRLKHQSGNVQDIYQEQLTTDGPTKRLTEWQPRTGKRRRGR